MTPAPPIRRSACALALAGLVLLAGCASTGEPGTDEADTTPRPPNILFIFADDWGFGDLSCHGHPHIQTPHLDKLASQGTDFHQFTVASGVCSPSRAAMLTGHFPARYSVHRHFNNVRLHRSANMPDWLDPDAPTLPRMLKDTGYTTHHYGKWHLTNNAIPDAPQPLRYGYDRAAVWNGPGAKTRHDEVFDLAIEAIENADGKPFFINLWVHETHLPMFPRPELVEQYQNKGLSKPDSVYAAVVTNADEQIGRVLKALDDAGLADNTLVVFSSDNGPETPANQETNDSDDNGTGLGRTYSRGTTGGLKGAKRSLHEGGVRVPLIARWPGRVPAGKIDSTSIITGVDWLPTLCAIADAPLPRGYEPDGEDRSATLLGRPTERIKPIYWYWPTGSSSGANWPQAAIRAGKWKLLMTLDGRRVELYDIPNDRAEETNLAEKYPRVVSLLRDKLNTWVATLPQKPDPKCFSELRKQY